MAKNKKNNETKKKVANGVIEAAVEVTEVQVENTEDIVDNFEPDVIYVDNKPIKEEESNEPEEHKVVEESVENNGEQTEVIDEYNVPEDNTKKKPINPGRGFNFSWNGVVYK